MFARDLTEDIKKNGGDSVFAGTDIVAFEPGQIKSVVGNIGTFTDNPDIRYSRDAGEAGTALDEVLRIADDLAREYKMRRN